MNIEKLSDKNIKGVTELERICFSNPWSESDLAWEQNNKNSHFIVATNANEVIGYAGIYVAADEGDIARVAVLPNYRNKNVGSTLLGNLFADLDGIEKIFLDVRKSNKAAINLYKKFGFTQVGIRKNYYSLPTEDAVIMKK